MRNNTISANTLFHFTKTIENVRNILAQTFSPRYCLEHIDFISSEKLDMAIPMVCFCDIPLSQIIDHVDTYGEYAIGLNKDWAMSKGISPVLYLYKNSLTNKIINELFKTTFKLDKITYFLKKDLTDPATLDFCGLLFYCKIYKGKMWREGRLKENKTFYNEREWRYIPNLNDLEWINPRLIIGKDEYNNSAKRTEYNDQIKHLTIGFAPKDIKYIIISKESERLEMINMIEHIKGNDYSLNDLKELNSKIISVEQIKDDF
jgi:Protein of unknown function (DUF2743).